MLESTNRHVFDVAFTSLIYEKVGEILGGRNGVRRMVDPLLARPFVDVLLGMELSAEERIFPP